MKKTLATQFNNSLSSEIHIYSLCKNTSYKLHTLWRILKYIWIWKKQVFNESVYNLPVQLLWTNLDISYKIQETVLRLVYQNSNFSFTTQIEIDIPVTMHQKYCNYWNFQKRKGIILRDHILREKVYIAL